MGETGIRGAAKVARDEGEILREHIVVGAFGKLRRHAGAATALIEIAAAGNEFEVLFKYAVLRAPRLIIGRRAFTGFEPITGFQFHNFAPIIGGILVTALSINGETVCRPSDQSHLLPTS